MTTRDTYLLRFLAQNAPTTAAEVKVIMTWWNQEAQPEEGVLKFLVRQQVLVSEAASLVGQMEKGYVQFPDGDHLFAEGGLVRLTQWAASQQVEEQMADQANASLATVRPDAWTETRGSAAPETPAPAGLPALGTVLGKCLLTERLGQGSAGVVYRAMHQSLGIPVAVKVLQLSAQDDPSVHHQLRSEARLLAQLNHPHLVRVWDFEDDATAPYLVLEYVEGLSLAELIQQSGQLRWDRAVRLMIQVSQALSAAQQIGVVHRDVKPGNILITRDGSAKLADLGLAVVVGPKGAAMGGASGFGGTAAYMAPEQVQGTGSIDHRADIYALGGTFYHAVTGQLPFTGKSRLEVMLKHVRDALIPANQVDATVPKAVSAVITKMMAKNPEDRYQSFEELLEALQGLLQDSKAAPAGDSGKRGSVLWKYLASRFSRTEPATASA